MKIYCNAYKGTGIYSLYLTNKIDGFSFDYLEMIKNVLNDLDIYEPYGEKLSYIKYDDFEPPLADNIIIRLTEEEFTKLRLTHDVIIQNRSMSFALD